MRHEGGMSKFSQPLKPEWLTTESIKNNKIGEIIEKETLDYNSSETWCPGVKREYHAMTRDIVGNEIFRRVHPDEKTMGEYMREDFGPKFGINGIFIGMKGDEVKRKVPYETLGMFRILKEIWYGPEHYPTALSMAVLKGNPNAKKGVEEGKKNWPEFKRNEEH